MEQWHNGACRPLSVPKAPPQTKTQKNQVGFVYSITCFASDCVKMRVTVVMCLLLVRHPAPASMGSVLCTIWLEIVFKFKTVGKGNGQGRNGTHFQFHLSFMPQTCPL